MIVITAPTGKIGHRVLAGVLETGVPLRVIVRDAGKLPKSVRDLVEVVEGSHVAHVRLPVARALAAIHVRDLTGYKPGAFQVHYC